ncbi:MAG: hypothetical protein MSA90_21920 [Faecalicatena sp.]|uniref:hypothetical protein n=1 Tax=Faecalicatena sp. TaxID=2005360 RepID=UPI002589E622|nr:hypothetical protein [Faecalicatena sp.]MCI6468108.1 hypothetical protein [Faecalicatena sp.]MDY4670922.1 hypothetical protein [Oliverpabstia sp.]MDY5620361.1 hypothetical protein [Lachnospiraceae bacterium]
MKKYNLSKIMKRAWTLVKKESMDISSALKKSWREEKEMKENNLIETLKANLEDMAYSDHNINAGIDRQVSEKKWENGENKRTYLSINCYTCSGRFKGAYKCGYVDEVTGSYVCSKYDDVDALAKKYIGR